MVSHFAIPNQAKNHSWTFAGLSLFLSKISIITAIITQFLFMYFHLFSDLERPEIICYIGTSMNVICIEEKAFYTLLDGVIKYVKSTMEQGGPVKWMDKKEAMQLLRIKSATTLQKLRDEGKIRFSQPERKTYRLRPGFHQRLSWGPCHRSFWL